MKKFLIPYLIATSGSLVLFYLFTVGALWQVYEMSRSMTLVGVVSLVQFLPAVLLYPWTGPFADHFEKRSLLLATTGVAFLLSLGLVGIALGGTLTLPLLLLAVAALSAQRSFEATALAAWLPEGVPAADLNRAVAMVAFFKQVAKVAAPALSGVLLLLRPEGTLLYGAMALSSVFTFSALALTPRPEARTRPAGWKVPRANPWEGIAYVRRSEVLQGAIILDLVAGLFGGFTALLPAFAVEVLAADAVGAGTLRSFMGVGSLVGAAALARFPLNRNLGRHLIFSVGALGVVTLALAHSTDFLLAAGLILLFGALDSVSVNIRQTLIQIATPKMLRGRVTATGHLAILISNQLGEFRAGLLGGLLGVYPAVALGGLCTLGAATLWGSFFPRLAQLASYDEAASSR